MSDSSNSSMLSLQRRYLNLNLTKIIDRYEPLDDSSQKASQKGSKYYGNLNETIEEEISDHDDDMDGKISHSSRSSNRMRRKNKN